MQLKLFSASVSRSGSSRKRRAAHASLKKTASPFGVCDLWNQDSGCEPEMALLFLDIRNFTPLAKDHPASDVVHFVKKLFLNFQNMIRLNHGRIIETSGDGFYAAFGFDRNLEQAVNDAVRAGNSILKSLRTMNERSFEKTLNRRIEVGIGVHAGKVATGNLALANEDHFIVMGYAVNVAARLQSATKELNNNFIVSETVFNLLTDPPPGKSIAHLTLKGVTGPCKLHLIGDSYETVSTAPSVSLLS